MTKKQSENDSRRQMKIKNLPERSVEARKTLIYASKKFYMFYRSLILTPIM